MCKESFAESQSVFEHPIQLQKKSHLGIAICCSGIFYLWLSDHFLPYARIEKPSNTQSNSGIANIGNLRLANGHCMSFYI